MAQMIPTRLREDVKSQAEKLLYEAFQKQLSDEFIIFHSVAWQQRSIRGGAQDGEADFVIVHPKFGVLVLEVKGGLISYQGDEGRWYTYDIPLKKDPFLQATDNKHSLRRLLQDQPGWPKQRVTFAHAVAFPDVEINLTAVRLDAPKEIILDGRQLNRLDQWVRSVLSYWYNQGEGTLGEAGIVLLKRLLSPSLTFKPLTTVLETVPVLGVAIAQEDKVLLEFSQRQLELLDFLSRQRRVAISGCAGSGKTILAVEKARRLSNQGFKVILTCFNRNLAEFLRFSLEEEMEKGLLKVAHFHGLASELVHKAGLWPKRGCDTNSTEFFETALPTLMTEAADKLDWRVNAIVVDEGQDFHEEWWMALQYLLEDPDKDILYVFYDDHQNLYRPERKPIPLNNAPFTLTDNYRNTQHIHKFVSKFYRYDHPTKATGPMGRSVETVLYNSEAELKRHLSRLLYKLIIQEQVAEEDIVILTPLKPDRSRLWKLGVVGNFELVAIPGGRGGIFCTTIHQFKGLESPVVILVEMESENSFDPETLMYVGASRALYHLIIMSRETAS